MDIYRIKDLTKMLRVSSMTLWRWERAGKFPKRIQLGPNCVGWLADDIKAWLDARPRGVGQLAS